MRRKHRRTLAAIYRRPTSGGIRWDDAESLLLACGAYLEERAGSRIYIELDEVAAHLQRPHHQREIRTGAVASLRRFLKEAGIEP